MNSKVKTIALAVWLATLTLQADAQAQAEPAAALPALRAAVQQAIDTNPDVTSRFNAVRASGNEVKAARGGFLPRVDLSAEAGQARDTYRNRSPEGQSYGRTGVALDVNQLIWDGFVTSGEVDRLDHVRQARYFEFIDAAEQSALEAARAFYDVQRYRRLVALAEENYVQHKYTFDQLQTRFKAGVGRGVDGEQANARLALAESNLQTEIANLHDVTARYQRVVGDLPPATNASARLDTALPAGMEAATRNATERNASISAAVENLRAVNTQLEQRKAQRWQPKLEAHLHGGAGHNLNGNIDEKRDLSGMLLMKWNLFNGGSDDARVRQYADLLNQAADLRDKTCRDVRQTAAIAYNDIGKLNAEIAVLARNVESIQKTRDAYRQQFDIGQRSLLDLLNAENELYTARRAQANAQANLDTAYARVHAAGNTLLTALGLQNPRAAQARDEGSNDQAAWSAGQDAAGRCAVVPIETVAFNKAELDARAAQLAAPTRAAPAAPAPAKAEAPVTGAAVGQVEQRLGDWAAAWSAKDADRYLSFYSSTFAGKQPRAKWEAARRKLVTKPGPISVKLDGVKSRAIDINRVETRFSQSYSSQTFKDVSDKTLVWSREGGVWKIVSESNR